MIDQFKRDKMNFKIELMKLDVMAKIWTGQDLNLSDKLEQQESESGSLDNEASLINAGFIKG